MGSHGRGSHSTRMSYDLKGGSISGAGAGFGGGGRGSGGGSVGDMQHRLSNFALGNKLSGCSQWVEVSGKRVDKLTVVDRLPSLS